MKKVYECEIAENWEDVIILFKNRGFWSSIYVKITIENYENQYDFFEWKIEGLEKSFGSKSSIWNA